MGSYHMNWIIILFFIYLDVFKEEKVEESTCRVILVAGPSLENWGSKPSGVILRIKLCFLGLWCLTLFPPLLPYSTLQLIQMDLSVHPPLPLNHHFEPVVLKNHDIHPFYGEWNAISSSFVNYKHHLMIS
jgi:hypothetical protein